jgi:hypothetical protein
VVSILDEDGGGGGQREMGLLGFSSPSVQRRKAQKDTSYLSSRQLWLEAWFNCGLGCEIVV